MTFFTLLSSKNDMNDQERQKYVVEDVLYILVKNMSIMHTFLE